MFWKIQLVISYSLSFWCVFELIIQSSLSSFIFNILDLRLLTEWPFLLAVQSLHTSILALPDNFKSKEDYLSGSSIKGDYLVCKIGLSCHALCVLYFNHFKATMWRNFAPGIWAKTLKKDNRNGKELLW